jgi:hypothetical protein
MTENESDSIDSFVASLTEDQANLVFHAMMRRFDWVGTYFCTDDITGVLEDNADLANLDADERRAVEADIVARVKADYAWRKMPDRLAERGNETLWDDIDSHVQAALAAHGRGELT